MFENELFALEDKSIIKNISAGLCPKKTTSTLSEEITCNNID